MKSATTSMLGACTLLSAVIELVNPVAFVRIKEGFERVMEDRGRRIIAVLLLGVGASVARDAWHVMTKR